MADTDIDIDEPTVEVIRANDSKIKRLGAEIEQAGDGATQAQIVEFVECVKSQEAILSEVPGMEDHAETMSRVREQAQNHYGL